MLARIHIRFPEYAVYKAAKRQLYLVKPDGEPVCAVIRRAAIRDGKWAIAPASTLLTEPVNSAWPRFDTIYEASCFAYLEYLARD